LRRTTNLPAPFRCECGTLFECSSPVPLNGTGSMAKPSPGCLTLCLRCARLYRWSETMTLERCDVATLPEDVQKEIRRGQRAIHRLHRIPS
jgi:hypothetical protein